RSCSDLVGRPASGHARFYPRRAQYPRRHSVRHRFTRGRTQVNWGRLIRTVRPLRASQLGYRAYYRLRRSLEYSRLSWLRKRLLPSLRGALPVRPEETPGAFFHGAALDAEARARELSEGRLTLLNEQLPFRGGEDWGM